MLKGLQNTILEPVSFSGIGLHSGLKASVTLKPSLPNTGITFKRIDIKDGKKNTIRANFKNVTSAKLHTKIENSFNVSVSTIEHLLGALYGEGIDNILIEVDNAEIPIMDGSAIAFVRSIRSAGIKIQNNYKKVIEVIKKVKIEDGSKYISIEPLREDFRIDFKLEYKNKLIGNQQEILSIKNDDLGTIYNSRTFCLYEDVEKIKSRGLAKGGSLENAIVVKGEEIINKSGLREKNEFVKHKILDCLGDFMLTGHRMFGSIKCVHGGHQLTNDLLNKFFSDRTNWKFSTYESQNIEKQKYSYKNPIAVNA